MEEEEHEVYDGEIPDEAEMEGDLGPNNADVDMLAADEDAINELDEMKKRLKEMEEEEAAGLREMQAKVEKEMGGVQGGLIGGAVVSGLLGPASKVESVSRDGRHIYTDKAPLFYLIKRYTK